MRHDPGRELRGAEQNRQFISSLRAAFPDLRFTTDDLIAEGDKVVMRASVTGTHQGQYMGVQPTGKSIIYNEIFIWRFVGGRIAEMWGVVDIFSQLKQLGVIPAQRT